MDAGTALLQARLSGQPVPIGQGLFAYPDGSVGTPGGGFGRPNVPPGNALAPPAVPPSQQPPWWVQALQTPVAVGPPPAPAQPPLNQANPTIAALQQPGLPGSPSGPAVAPPGGFQAPSVVPPAQMPDVVVTARRYRQAHGLATADDSAITDRLNAESLAAAQAGRNYLQPGPYPAGGDVVANALTTPPVAVA